MSLKLYNTRTRTLEEFAPWQPPRVAMYVCGPTVYDEPHIGHARSAYVFDVIRRWLTYRGFQVDFVRNVTDVDDKIIEKARQEGRPAEAVAEAYLQSYHAALALLGIQPPTQEPRATAHIDGMVNLIAQLIVKGAAYDARGSVYFSVSKFPAYGRLANRSTEEMLSGTRGEPAEGKRDPLDFALWKAAKPGEPSWKSPWGAGRPGWHMECSAMSAACLGGPQIDIHGGGLDLLFPHHENEVAQSEAASGASPFATYWLHHGLLTINNQKMSKSLGNFVTVEQVVQHWGADTLKMFFLSAHYRSSVNYMEAAIAAAKQRYEGYRHLMDQAASPVVRAAVQEFTGPVPAAEELKQTFLNALDDDLNTPEALSALDGMRSLGWRLWDSEDTKGKFLVVARILEEHGRILGLFEQLEKTALSRQIDDLFERYKAARSSKDFKMSDALRRELDDQGFSVQDAAETSRLIPKR